MMQSACSPRPGHPRVGASVVDTILHANGVRKVELKVERCIMFVVNVHSYACIRVRVVHSAGAAEQRKPLLGDDVRKSVAWVRRLRELKQNLHTIGSCHCVISTVSRRGCVRKVILSSQNGSDVNHAL